MPEASPKVKANAEPARGGRGILARIVEVKRAEVEALRGSEAALREAAAEAWRSLPPRGLAAALRRAGEVRLLAEVKRRSPSAGEIRPDLRPAEVARAYQRGGAAGLSVLTDRDFFGGSLDALREVRAAVELPLLRKDFVIDPLQVWEARGAGADAVLLIARILSDRQLAQLLALAEELGMDALVEAHDAHELRRARAAGARLVGVNNRDLDTFTTDLALAERLAAGVGSDVVLVGESGIRTPADVARMGAAGIDAVLVGESLMREPDVEAAARALTGQVKADAARG